MAIVGPTAAGKTGLAIALAKQFNGEIINADSRQVYRHLDIGTAKPTPQQRQQAPHHIIDILNPDQDFSLGAFLALAKTARDEILSRKHLPLLIGGAGQYVWGFLEDWNPAETLPDDDFRRAKEQEARESGADAIYQQLRAIDPERARQLDPRNLRRVIRALEIFHLTGRKPSEFGSRSPAIGESLIIGLTTQREKLYQRIDQRVDDMMAAGFLAEVQNIQQMGYALGVGPLASLGYREMAQHLAGEISLEEAVQRTKFQTHRLARRQYAWFKLNDPRISWLDALDPTLEDQAAELVADFLSEASPVRS